MLIMNGGNDNTQKNTHGASDFACNRVYYAEKTSTIDQSVMFQNITECQLPLAFKCYFWDVQIKMRDWFNCWRCAHDIDAGSCGSKQRAVLRKSFNTTYF